MKTLQVTSHSRFGSLLMILLSLTLVISLLIPSSTSAQGDDPTPPAEEVKLIFIHHSSGENWLNDENGGLGRSLGENNYFVSDTNYGWGPDGIGDRTDILNWTEWFRGPDSARYLDALYNESGQNSPYTRDLPDPGGENQIIMFKSCFPNSSLEGNPDDPAAPGDGLTVSNAKFIYNDLLQYFISRPDKLFIVITAPPVQDSTYADNARAFNTWLVKDWLVENNYPYPNVAVFDFYNVLTGADNHHRFQNGAIEYISDRGKNTAYYPTEDDHPSEKGNRKATTEFIPLLNIFYHRWKSSASPSPIEATQTSPAPEETQTVYSPPQATTVDELEPTVEILEAATSTLDQEAEVLETAVPEVEEKTEKPKLCGGGLLLPVVIFGLGWLISRKRS